MTSGHTFLIVDHHGPTDRVLTLESNSYYKLNGVGFRVIGYLQDMEVQPPANWWDIGDLMYKLYEMQLQYFDLLDNKNADEALDQAQKTQTYLNQVLPPYPQDPDLKVTRGYLASL